MCADESCDSSSKEQLPLIVDRIDTIREEFIDFIGCDSGTSGVALADKILEAL